MIAAKWQADAASHPVPEGSMETQPLPEMKTTISVRGCR